ncbi:hypothetical protein A4E84_39760 [Streptomyces qaidamensis]|uniref:Uncharacterized protein n=1 Tax=Streptomyces qaidamensis TaxID=1783515 RepID=A0A143CCT3_9ACTN|nr:hypothetical protein A4E84_39760 [Streptomyces qaidamensis]
MGAGQCNVKHCNRHLRDLITEGRVQPGFGVSHELPLDRAPMAYDKIDEFDERIEGCINVVLHLHA